PLHPPPFPTRRSSDRPRPREPNDHPPRVTLEADRLTGEAAFDVTLQARASDPDGNRLTYAWRVNDELISQANTPTLRLTIYEARSEEHTSELQSRENL